MTPPISHDRFDNRLQRVVDVISGKSATDEVAQFMDAPSSKLNGARPWDLLAWAEDEDFERCLDALLEWVEERRSSLHTVSGSHEKQEG